MRISLRIAVILAVFSGHALAAPKAGAGKKGAQKRPLQTMDQNDPAAKELSEKREEAAKPDTEQVKAQRELEADAAAVADARAKNKVGVFGNVLIGFGKAPEPGPGAQVATGKTTSATFMVGGHYDLSPDLTLSVRVPWTVGSARQVDGTSATVQALGSPELRGEYRVGLSPFTRIPLFVGIGLPLAQGNYDQTNSSVRQTRAARLNAVADAASGYRDPELFGPKRVPLVLGGGIDYQRKALSAHAATKFVFGMKVGGTLANPDDATGAGSYELKSVTFRNVTSAGVAYRLLDKPYLYGALDSWVVYNAIHPVEFKSNQGAGSPTRFQVVFEPRVGARFGKISPSIGYIFPIGGRLADNSTSGLELHCDVAF